MNYGQIKSAVAYYLTRTDVDAVQIKDLAEQRIYYGESTGPGGIVAPALRVSAMLKTGNSPTLPTDFLSMERVMSDRYRMDYLPWGEFGEWSQLQGSPRYYSIHAGQVGLAPTGGTDPLAYTYYGKFDPLLDDDDENWLSINAPNIYISSMMIEFARKSRDDALGTREAANYVSAINALMSTDRAAQVSGGMWRRSAGHQAKR